MTVAIPNNVADVTLEKFNIRDEYLKMLELRTPCLDMIKTEHIEYALSNVDRTSGLLKLMEYIDPEIADKLEAGTFEYALVKTTTDDLLCELIANIYTDKINDICANIDPKNKRIANNTLRISLKNGHINPYFVPFLSFDQVHPSRWKDILDKKASIENELNNIKVSDIYKCYKCGCRRTKTSQMQTRSADEPMTIFVTCLDCYNTFTK